MTGVAVCVCTYKRHEQLGRALESLAKIARPEAAFFVIVDNDGSDPRVAIRVDEFRRASEARVEYVVEKRPGISAARNAAFAVSRSAGASAIAMLDDDEWASPDWLAKLLETQSATGSGVVGGPVQPVFPAHSQNLSKYAWLWSARKAFLNGRVYVSCTCNCLIDIPAAAFLGEEPFPNEFGLTGGEDAVFFRRLHRAGVPMAWCEGALVFEGIPEERASLAWMRRRWYRQGFVALACEQMVPDGSGLSPASKTALLCMRFPFYPLFNRKALAHPAVWRLEMERLRGRIEAHLGKQFAEYGREQPASATDNESDRNYHSCVH